MSNDNPSAYPSGSNYKDGLSPVPSPSTKAFFRPTLTSSHQASSFHSPLRQETANAPNVKQFFCTFCAELGTLKIIKTKQDWKRHEEDYHVGTGNQWFCQVPGCCQVFDCGADFKRHLKRDHEGKKFPRDSKEVRQLERVYACGFENCRTLDVEWKHRCNHVATHMLKGHTAWTYDRTIRNLLKQPAFSAQWKNIYGTMGPPRNLTQTDLSWNPETTRKLREQLELHSFDCPIEEFLQRLFLLGVPKDKVGKPNLDLSQQIDFGTSTTSSTVPPRFHEPSTSLGAFAFDVGSSEDTRILAAGPQYHGRGSVHMTEELSFNAYDNLNVPPESFDAIPSADEELCSVEEFICDDMMASANPRTFTVDDNTSKHGSTRNLMRKSKEWLTSKKSQHFQPITLDHPDIPLSSRLPSSPRKK